MNETNGLENAKKLYDKRILASIFKAYLQTEGYTLQELAKKYDCEIGVDGDGDDFIAPIIDGKYIIQLAYSKKDKTIVLGSYIVVVDNKTDDDSEFTGTYYIIPDLDELQAMSYN